MDQRAVRTHMHHRGKEFWLALFLRQHQARLDYARAWRHARVTEYMLCVWALCIHLPALQCRRARRKIEYFLSSGNLLPSSPFVVSLSCSVPCFQKRCKLLFGMYLGGVCSNYRTPYMEQYLRQKTMLIFTKSLNVSDRLSHHCELAAKCSAPLHKALKQSPAYADNIHDNVL
eukprot:1683017-Pyramimonas_sp.AAC.1